MANRGQHYVKTAESLRDYAFTVDMLGIPSRVRFTLGVRKGGASSKRSYR